MLFRGFAGFFEGAGGVFMRLTGKLVGGDAALAMRGMGGEVVVLGGSVVWALGHLISPQAG
jgi:hypothetical protein